MEYYLVIICALVAWLSKLRTKNIYNPLTVFFSFWAIIIGLASLSLFGLYEATDRTYNVIATGLLSYFIGYILIRIANIPIFNSSQIKVDNSPNVVDKYVLRYNVLYFLYFITIIYMLFRIMNVVVLLSQGQDLSSLRGNFSSDILGGTAWSIFYENYVNKVLIFMIIPIAVVDYFLGKKDSKLLIVAFILAIFSSIGDGGRVTFYYVFIHFLTAALIFKKRLNISKKTKNTIIFISITGIIGMYIITEMRGVSVPIYQQLYLYFAGCIPHLDYRLEQIDENGTFTYGWAFILGFIKPLFQLLGSSGLFQYPQSYLDALMLSDVENFVQIGNRLVYNAFVTPFFYFYLDGGIIGVVICSFIYGAICSLSYSYVKNKPNMLNLFIYLMLMQGIFTSMIRWQFTVSAFALVFLYMPLVFKKSHKN